MSTRRYHGQRPRWDDPNVANREQLQRGLLRTPPPADSLGLAVKARAREAGEAYTSEQAAENPFYRSSEMGMNQARANAQMRFGGWGGYFQAMQEAANRIAGPNATLRVAGGPSPEGSTQLRGTQGLEFGHGARAMEISAPEHRRSSGIADNPDWWVSGESDPTMRSQLEQRMDRMPANLRGLYIAGLREKAKKAKA